MISRSNKQLQQRLEYTLLNPDCHSWWISKVQSGRENTSQERYAIKFCFKLGKSATETYGMLQTAFRPLQTRWASRQFLSLPIVETLLPMIFGYSLSSEAVVMRQLSRWKRLWRRSLTRSHKRSSMGPRRSCWNGTTSSLQPEKITFMCVLSIKVPIRKKSGDLFNDPRTCGTIITVKHILLERKKFTPIGKRYFKIRNLTELFWLKTNSIIDYQKKQQKKQKCSIKNIWHEIVLEMLTFRKTFQPTNQPT